MNISALEREYALLPVKEKLHFHSQCIGRKNANIVRKHIDLLTRKKQQLSMQHRNNEEYYSHEIRFSDWLYNCGASGSFDACNHTKLTPAELDLVLTLRDIRSLSQHTAQLELRNKVSFADFERSRNSWTLTSRYIFISREIGDWNNDKYSKGWHRAHGGVYEITERSVSMISRKSGKLLHKFDVDKWQGHWFLNTLNQYNVTQTVTSKIPKKIRLRDDVKARKCGKTAAGHQCYALSVLGQIWQYAVVSGKHVFHHQNMDALDAGLKLKIEQKNGVLKRGEEKLIDVAFCQQLGFCSAGIQEACAIMGIDSDAQYELRHLRPLFKRYNDELLHFKSEIRTLLKCAR